MKTETTTKLYEVTFREEFYGEREELIYDDLLTYLESCVINGDVSAFTFNRYQEKQP